VYNDQSRSFSLEYYFKKHNRKKNLQSTQGLTLLKRHITKISGSQFIHSRTFHPISAYWPSVRSVLWNIRPRFFSTKKTEVWYFTIQTEQARSMIGLLYGWAEPVSICFSRELNRLSSVSLGNNIQYRHACSIKNNFVAWNFYL
jgi:hypothetical protein